MHIYIYQCCYYYHCPEPLSKKTACIAPSSCHKNRSESADFFNNTRLSVAADEDLVLNRLPSPIPPPTPPDVMFSPEDLKASQSVRIGKVTCCCG